MKISKVACNDVGLHLLLLLNQDTRLLRLLLASHVTGNLRLDLGIGLHGTLTALSIGSSTQLYIVDGFTDDLRLLVVV